MRLHLPGQVAGPRGSLADAPPGRPVSAPHERHPPLTHISNTDGGEAPFDAVAVAADVEAYSIERAYGSEATPSRVTTANSSGPRWVLTAL